jgi:DNA-binding transcriptional ArsR family regulator
MLWALSDGRALPAGELARIARISAATASAHLAKLVSSGFVRVDPSGRHRYYRLARADVVTVLEALATLAPASLSLHGSEPVTGVRLARTCYDHLAGRAGVRITEGLLDRAYLVEGESGYTVTRDGDAFCADLGIRVGELRQHAGETRRAFARPCLDWSERRYHVAGALGSAICTALLRIEWFERLPGTRALRVTSTGRRAMRRALGVQLF